MLRLISKLLLVCVLCTSCNYFSPQKSSTTSNLQVLDTVIDYTSVTKYPIFPDCTDYNEDDNRKGCFETSITQKLSELLSRHELKVNNEVNDETSIDILIDQMGKASLVDINSSPSIEEELPNLEQIVRESINQLPFMDAAQKNGMPVKSQYRLVIVVETM